MIDLWQKHVAVIFCIGVPLGKGYCTNELYWSINLVCTENIPHFCLQRRLEAEHLHKNNTFMYHDGDNYLFQQLESIMSAMFLLESSS